MQGAFVTCSVRALVMAAFFLLSGSLWAGSFNVNPVRVELSAQRASAALTVQNNGDETAVIQAQTMAWSQEKGQDQYAASDDLLVTPPIFTIEPGAVQIVRVGMRRVIRADQELSYRLFLQEVPPPPKPGFRGLQVALRIGIPIFIAPKIKVAPVLLWTVARHAGNQIQVGLKNDGKAHIRVTDFSVFQPDRETPLAIQQVAVYLLPGQSRTWLLPGDPAQSYRGDKVRITADTDIGKIDIDAALDKL
jgi:fimbrial chaperone protein